MTSFNRFRDRNRDMQDGTERHIYHKLEYVKDAGSVIHVKGTGTEDEEAIVYNNGMGGTFPEDTDAEVLLLAGGSDTAQKFAMVSIPADKQRQWEEGANGFQYWNDPARAVEFNAKRTYIDDANVATRDGLFEVKDGKVYFRCDVMVDGNIGCTQKFQSPNTPETPPPVAGTGVTVPGFEK